MSRFPTRLAFGMGFRCRKSRMLMLVRSVMSVFLQVSSLSQCMARPARRCRYPSPKISKSARSFCLPVKVFVVLPQQILAVVVAIRSSHQSMNVEFLRMSVVQRDAGVVVEFDQDHRAVDSVVKRIFGAAAADP